MPGDAEKYDSLPIPTYEEATSSRPSSSASHRGPEEVSHDAVRQGLLGRQGPGAFAGSSNTTRRGNDSRGNYQPPTVESERSSYDSAFTSPEVTDDEGDDAELRRDLEEMEVSDPEAERRAQQRARMRREFQKRIASVTNTFSNIHLPRFPNITIFSSLRERFPRLSFPERGSVSWPIVARLVALLLIASVIYILIVVKITPNRRGIIPGSHFEPDQVRDFLIRHVDPSKIESHLRQLSADDHIAGTKGDIFLAQWIEDHFIENKLDSTYQEDFQVMMTYPKNDGPPRRVAITDPEEKRWESSLAEDVITEDLINPIVHPGQSASITRHQSPAFQPFAAAGKVDGPLIYANYGSQDDFRWLRDHGVVTDGAIALIRHYGSQPSAALKVAAAQEAGCAGALIYSDPAEDGPAQMNPPHSPADDPWRSADGVHRSSVASHNRVLGDPLTPGWSSTPDADRINNQSAMVGLPTIPSLPVSWRDATPMLEVLQNVGAPVPNHFAGAVPNIAYWTGNATSDVSPRVDMENRMDRVERQTIRNVLASLRGLEQPEDPIYVGAPRDALCFGATHPGSGTAILMELANLFGRLAANGWRPRRTLVFASWDASEYNAAGSTEHIESRADALRLHGISYINLASAVYGNQLKARGSPVFKSVLHATLARIIDPSTNTSLLDTWNATRADLELLPTTLGDWLPFHDIAGMSSLDLSFTSPLNADRAPPTADTASTTQQTPVAFPAGSCHDTLTWLTTHGDPGFVYHTLLTQVVAVLLYELADAPILPFDLTNYASTITSAIDDLVSDLHSDTDQSDSEVDQAFNLAMLRDAGAGMVKRVSAFETWTAGYLTSVGATLTPTPDDEYNPSDDANDQGGSGNMGSNPLPVLTGSSSGFGEPRDLAIRRVAHNQVIAEFESHLLDLPLPDVNLTDSDEPTSTTSSASQLQSKRAEGDIYGLPHAPQYKHIFHGPRLWELGRNQPFPAIREAFGAGDWDGVRRGVEVASSVVRWAGWRLGH